jgi:hypothetical protein
VDRESLSQQCPYCGETIELELDATGPRKERYVEDCPVCCRPYEVCVTRTDEGLDVSLKRDDD